VASSIDMDEAPLFATKEEALAAEGEIYEHYKGGISRVLPITNVLKYCYSFHADQVQAWRASLQSLMAIRKRTASTLADLSLRVL